MDGSLEASAGGAWDHEYYPTSPWTNLANLNYAIINSSNGHNQDLFINQGAPEQLNSNYKGQEPGTVMDRCSADGSLDSLDCLLSATNSNNTTADTIEDDDQGISLLFSSESFWNNSTDDNKNNIIITNGTAVNNSGRGNKRKIVNIQQDGNDKNNPQQKPKKTRRYSSPAAAAGSSSSSNNNNNNINFQSVSQSEPDEEAIAQMKEMMYRAAAFRPLTMGAEEAEAGRKPKRKNVRISTDPQTVAARQRRERISERIRVLQKLVPGGTKMDTASMLDEAANYLNFLRSQVKALENNLPPPPSPSSTNFSFFTNYISISNSGGGSSNSMLLPMQTNSLKNPNNLFHHRQL